MEDIAFWAAFYGSRKPAIQNMGQDILVKLKPPTAKGQPPVLMSESLIDTYGPHRRGDVLAILKALFTAGVIVHHGAGAISLPQPESKGRRPTSRKADSTPLDITRCRCGVMVLRGFCDGLSYDLDTDPLTATGAATAIATGHRAFTVTSAEKWKAGLPTDVSPPTATVHRDHRCDADPIEFSHRRPMPMSAQARANNEFDGEPPF